MRKISTTNTKAEILKAYQELQNELKEQGLQNTALQQELEKKRKMVAVAVEQTKDGGATHTIRHIRESLNAQLDKIEQGIAGEQQKFEELQKAIVIEKKTLEDLYKVKAEAESLEALVITNKQAKEHLEKEMEERKAGLLAEIEGTKMQWKREQEGYEYNLKIKRRDEEDAYLQKKLKQEKELSERKVAFEKEINEREQAVGAQEEELERLRKEVAGFEERLQNSVEATEKSVTARLTKEFEYLQKLETKDLEANLKLGKQEIESLKVKVKEQQELIHELSSKTDGATQQVKDIALKAIENSGIRNFPIPTVDRKSDEDKK